MSPSGDGDARLAWAPCLTPERPRTGREEPPLQVEKGSVLLPSTERL